MNCCRDCICRKCLYWWSSRCPYGECYDDMRANADPYDARHPGQPPRKQWTDWNKPGEQRHWCRGGTLYPSTSCPGYVRYTGSTVQQCLGCNVQVFQDRYISLILLPYFVIIRVVGVRLPAHHFLGWSSGALCGAFATLFLFGLALVYVYILHYL